MNVTTTRRRRKETAMGTKAAAVARVGVLGLAVGVLLFAALLGAARPAGAQAISTTTNGWTKANFRSSCEAAGGTAGEIRQTDPLTGKVDVDYSYCKFPGGDQNRCDWIKKVCTFGLAARGVGTHAPIGGGALAPTEAAPGGQGTRVGAVRAGAGTVLAVEDDDEEQR